MDNLSNGWVCRPRADGYGVVGKREGRFSKKSGCRLRRLGVQSQSRRLRRGWQKRRTFLKEVWVPTQTAGCAGPEPTATAWSAKEKDASLRSLGADADGWECVPRADCYGVLGRRTFHEEVWRTKEEDAP